MSQTKQQNPIQKALINGKNRQDPYDPFPWYKKMRTESPIHYDEDSKVWSVFRYDDVKRVISDKDFFSNQFPQLGTGNTFAKTMISMDPPKHTRIRSIVNKAFTPRVMKEWEPRIRELTNQLLADVRGREEIDLVQDFSYPLPVIVISELLGVPLVYKHHFKEWSDLLVSLPKSDRPEDVNEWKNIRDQGEEELTAFFEKMIEEKRQNLGNDLISLLIKAEQEGDKLSPDELVPFCNLLLMAGNETTTNLVSNAVYSILETPGVYDELARHPELIPQAVEEAVRFRAPAPMIVRFVKQDTEIRGVSLKKGEGVIAFLASANRDETKFERAHEFDIHRHPNPHIGFGHGIHFCLGAPLARLEAAIAIEALLKQYASMEKLAVVPMADSSMYGLKHFRLRVKSAGETAPN
ncbi:MULTISPECIES: cytochrome P450 [Bacillus]|uniref:Cytochrome P450 n=3 Tax=Bacillus licheniformis TaxID=1402 RepID=Q65MS1_BACLD|nr:MULTISPECIES: cytochrome P450 [Bacillus]AAU22292.1 Cytochrome P450 [Bacillus licheniformis DSM 13 = ATCC 14580]AAU39643.1 putative cytochrome P450 monooxygenase YjiB [Bacillus licheniformis DSM 13 = ATCC 14580]MBG9698511.1 cytochrome P450 [Bacillus licheniformis]MCR3917309.1 cytochrome P450 [Bacillus licheniformis]MCY8022764.1 cytochrome P450 [Bacillus licheniformis]